MAIVDSELDDSYPDGIAEGEDNTLSIAASRSQQDPQMEKRRAIEARLAEIALKKEIDYYDFDELD